MSSINSYTNGQRKKEELMKTAKILIIDIETAPNLAYVWGAWKQNIHQAAWVEKGYIMSYAAKWLGKDKVYYEDNRKGNDKKIVKSMFKLMDEADILVAHNGRKFDFPTIIGRGCIHGFTPPSPYHIVDTLETARREFRLTNNTLANLCIELGLPLKSGHKKFAGFDLWVQCIKGNPEAWNEMESYNIQDIVTLEALYLRLRPYMKSHPSVVRSDNANGHCHCPKCGSADVQFRGYYYTRIGMAYHRFACMDCGGWGKLRNAEKDKGKSIGRNAA
jgi:DNA polymerase elongation subunit (family B)